MTASLPDGADPGADPEADGARDDLTLRVVEERLAVAKRRVAGDVVRVTTATDTVEEVAEVELDRYRVEVTRVPVGRPVDAVPPARAEGDTTVVPVVEERLVVVKQLFLVEELHIRHVVERELRREAVTLRRQRATVERVERPDGDARSLARQEPACQPSARPEAAGSPQATKAPLR